MNWKSDNLITAEMGGECYTTQDLEICFRELKRDGYSAVSLGLIIDLVRTLERADKKSSATGDRLGNREDVK